MFDDFDLSVLEDRPCDENCAACPYAMVNVSADTDGSMEMEIVGCAK